MLSDLQLKDKQKFIDSGIYIGCKTDRFYQQKIKRSMDNRRSSELQNHGKKN